MSKMDNMNKTSNKDLESVSGGELEWELYEFMDAAKCRVGSYAITPKNWWYQCKAADETHESNYWKCEVFDDTPTVLYARTRNSNE